MKKALLLTAGAIAIAIAIWWARSDQPVRANRQDAGVTPQAVSAAEASRRLTLPEGVQRQRESEADTAAVARIQIVPASSGRVLWSRERIPWLAGRQLWGGLAQAGQPAGIGSATWSGAEVSVPLSADEWTWMCVQSDGAGHRYLLLPASRTDLRTSMAFATTPEPAEPTDKAVLHVFAVDENLRGPASGAAIAVYRRSTTDADTELVIEAETNATGYLRAAVGEPGTYLVCCGDTKPGDPAPSVMAVILPPGETIVEAPCTVVRPEKRVGVKLSIECRTQRSSIPFLYFRRYSDKPGVVTPLQGMVANGNSQIEARLAPGTYELGALPLGDWTLIPGARTYDIQQDGTQISVRVDDLPQTVELKLHGIPDHRLPVTVRPVQVGALHSRDDQAFFCGQHRWYSTTGMVGPIAYDCRFVITSRRTSWISRSVFRPGSGRRFEVDVSPATTLEIVWECRDQAQSQALLDVAVEGWTETVVLHGKLSSGRSGAPGKTLIGSFVVPEGPVHLRCWDADSGTDYWKEAIVAKGDTLAITR